MYPHPFDLERAHTVADALSLLAAHTDAGTETQLLAGGHSLLPTMKSRLASPDVLIDISGIDAMDGIAVDDGVLSIGALTTYATIAGDEVVRTNSPALAAAAATIGDQQVRNLGTIGGNLVHADPASDLPGAALAAGATLVVAAPDGERHVPADEFFLGMYTTDVDDRELLTRIRIPTESDPLGAYAKRPSPASGYAVVGIAAQLALQDGIVDTARVGANGIVEHGVRLGAVEDALIGEPLGADVIESAAARATADIETGALLEDTEASAAYREQLATLYTERALADAAAQA